jgi:hypothetical protein
MIDHRHAFGTFSCPTGADFLARLEAIGLGRWASLYSGARETEGARTLEGRERR